MKQDSMIKNRFLKEVPSYVKKAKIGFSKNSLEVIKKRFLLKDKQEKIQETVEGMFWRVVRAITLEEAKYVKNPKKVQPVVEEQAKRFFELLSNKRFLPNTAVYREAGNEIDGSGQLCACFVLPIEDSLDSAFQIMKEASLVQKNNGGTGFNFSRIRPKGDEVGGTPNVAAGPIHFIRSFSQSFDQILQGKKRGGGNMGILNIDHPDIEQFIALKSETSEIRNFNLSVGITDKFMKAVQNDNDFSLINPRNGKAVKKVKARQLFNQICENAWQSADPGIFFLDRAQKDNPTPSLGKIEATNPCGEQPLRAYESCNLGSVYLPTHLKKGSVKNKEAKNRIDWDLLADTVEQSVRFLDNMLDLSQFPLKKIEDEVAKTRKIGLGVIGWAEILFTLEIPYNSQEALDLLDQILVFISEEAVKASEKLAKERGVFPAYKKSVWVEKDKKVRNAALTTIAPNGTLSLVLDTSSGIEPFFSLAYERRAFYQDDGQENTATLLYSNPLFEKYAKDKGFYSKKLMKTIADNKGSLQGLDDVPKSAKEIFVTAHDISPLEHIKMQAVAQKHIDSGVSKTVNLPHKATVEDVKQVYIKAWEMGCKGVTVYRDGSKEMQVVNLKKTEALKAEEKQILKEDNDQFELTENALHFLERRALNKDSEGKVVETPNQLWQRIAKTVAKAENDYDKDQTKQWEARFEQILKFGQFLCGGAFIASGLGKGSSMTKCLVLPIEDSVSDIYETLKLNVEVLKRGIGTGFNFSNLRSSFSIVDSTGEKAAGPVEYLKIFNQSQSSVKGRGGRSMGSMAILNVDHPDILEFIEMKDELSQLAHYNISVGISDKFMQAVKDEADWELIDPHDKRVYKKVKARKLFKEIAKHAWRTGDPGLFFLDKADRDNKTPQLGQIKATNPCGEQPLLPYETCNLGNIDISKFVKDFPWAKEATFRDLPLEEKMDKWIKWDQLKETIQASVRFLDNIIDINEYAIKEIEDMTKKTRNIGLGIMGLADFLVKLGISYQGEEAVKATEKVIKFIEEEAHAYSQELGKEKGNFPVFNQSTYRGKVKYQRNARLTTIAPTGSVSIVADCNPGIEPIFALGYRRQQLMGGKEHEQVVVDKLFTTVAKVRGFYSEELMKEVAEGKSLSELVEKYEIPADVVEVFKTAHEIKPEQHVKIQAACQNYIDSGVSKTVNLPNSATWKDIARVYQLAWELGCKGITVFRDGCRDGALVVGTQDQKAESSPQDVTQGTESTQSQIQDSRQKAKSDTSASGLVEPRERGEVTKGKTYRVKTEQGSLFVTVNEDDIGISEVFLSIGKSGSFTTGYTSAIARLMSISLRAGLSPLAIIDQLQGIRTSQPTMNKGMIVYSVPDAVAKILKQHLDEAKKQPELPIKEAESQRKESELKGEPKKKSKEEDSTTPRSQESETMETTEKKVEKLLEVHDADDEAPSSMQTKGEYSDEISTKYSKVNVSGDLLECPECGADLVYAEGCILCQSCGYSKCG